MEDKKQEYIDYFRHMQEEDKRTPLGGIAWDDVAWWSYNAIERDNLFTRDELADIFPDLLGYLKST